MQIITQGDNLSETRKIVRFMATDIDGSMKLRRALMKLKGVDFMISNAVTKVTGIDPEKKIGDLGDSELKSLESAIKSPVFPAWMLNRRKDINTGLDKHIIGSEIDLEKREDINLMKRMKSYKGLRHEIGQPVRGQRTRSTFRTQKTVGVSKKAVKQAKSGTPKK
jgi:small subunit ribosomal protein S13